MHSNKQLQLHMPKTFWDLIKRLVTAKVPVSITLDSGKQLDGTLALHGIDGNQYLSITDEFGQQWSIVRIGAISSVAPCATYDLPSETQQNPDGGFFKSPQDQWDDAFREEDAPNERLGN